MEYIITLNHGLSYYIGSIILKNLVEEKQNISMDIAPIVEDWDIFRRAFGTLFLNYSVSPFVFCLNKPALPLRFAELA